MKRRDRLIASSILLLVLVGISRVNTQEVTRDPLGYILIKEKVTPMESLELMYNESTQNLIITYRLESNLLRHGDAFTMTRDRIIKYMYELGYLHYKVYSEDVIKYHGDYSTYTRFIKFYDKSSQ
jgi:hypothetical protein